MEKGKSGTKVGKGIGYLIPGGASKPSDKAEKVHSTYRMHTDCTKNRKNSSVPKEGGKNKQGSNERAIKEKREFRNSIFCKRLKQRGGLVAVDGEGIGPEARA